MLQRTPEKGSGGAWVGAKYMSDTTVHIVWLTICRFIPEGTGVFLPPYVLHRDPRYFFPSPDQFWPERWLESDASTDFVHNTTAFIPFSFGPANCIGKYLAYRTMRVVIVSVIRKYDFSFADGYQPERFIMELKDDDALVKGQLPVVLSQRV